MTMPAERRDFCVSCGTAPCQHPSDGSSLDLPMIVVYVVLGLLLGFAIGAWVW